MGVGLHTIIGLHHTLWAVTGGAWLLSSSSTDPIHRMVRSKIAVDGASVLTFISVFVCFPMNALGLPRNPELERLSWVAVFVCPVLWLLADLLISRVPPADPRPRS